MTTQVFAQIEAEKTLRTQSGLDMGGGACLGIDLLHVLPTARAACETSTPIYFMLGSSFSLGM